ncbi:MAG: 50S ribosomal protein L32 [Minisyncoccia bacterium]
MVVPAKHTSRSKVRRRRSQIFLEKKNFVRCKQCNNLILPHRICPFCGFYKGKKYLEIKEEKKKKK